MPYISSSIKIAGTKNDRRVKLTEKDKQEILRNPEGLSQRKLALMYGVSRRTIQFILDPAKLERNKQARKERGGWKQYYDKEAHRVSIAEHRSYKQSLFLNGDIKQKEL